MPLTLSMSESVSDEETSTDPETLLDALGGRYSVDILEAADEPVSAQELSDEMDVPIATCYRRIEDLVDAGLLRPEGRELSEQGRRTNVYRRTVDEVTVDLADPSVSPAIVEQSGTPGPLGGE
jgi:predicted transcriptional regulator